MHLALRYVAFAVLLLAACSLAAVCGEGMCESHVHAWHARVERAERVRRVLARLLADFAAAVALPVLPPRPLALSACTCSQRAAASPVVLGSLRI